MISLTIAVYWPGLSGDFLFDDNPHIVRNELVQITANKRALLTGEFLIRSEIVDPEFFRPGSFLRRLASFGLAQASGFPAACRAGTVGSRRRNRLPESPAL